MSSTSSACYDISQIIFKNGSPWTQQQFDDYFLTDNKVYELIYDKDKLIGFSLCSVVLDEAELLLLGVHPDYRQQGVGKELLTCSTQQLKTKHIKQLFLETRESNKRAILFYQSFGFKELARRKNYYHHPVEDGIMMSLSM